MTPFYWRGTTNFGDYMNEWLWPNVLDGYLEEDGLRMIGIGSLLKDSLNYVKGKKIIFGTGSGYGAIPNKKDFEDWLFYFVRGPRTAKLFGLDPRKSIVDGAWLISQVPEYQTIPVKKGTSFVPHWTTSETGNWQKVCLKAGFDYIDPLGDLHGVLKSIASSELVITESLHGAIIADYFRTPWVPVSVSPKFLPFKWLDWFESVELTSSIKKLPYSDLFEYIYNKRLPNSKDFSLGYENMQSQTKVNTEIISHDPGMLYPYISKLKGRIKVVRSMAFHESSKYRDLSLFSGWNDRHQDRVVGELMKLKSGQSFLSSDFVRSDRICRLEEVVCKLKKDYDQGVFN